jgi:alpha-ribazole phosphatase
MNEFRNTTKKFLSTGGHKLIMIRSCENIGSLSGCLSGWLDVKPSEYGRKQAKYLSLEYFIDIKNINSVYTSDLLRCKNTAEICLAYEDIKPLVNQNLREIYYGKQEGLFYDGLSKDEKAQINKQDYKFEEGESWLDMKFRALKFLTEIGTETAGVPRLDLVFTHGGFITNLLYSSGVKQILPSGSVILLSLTQYEKTELVQLHKEYQEAKTSLDTKELFSQYNEIVQSLLKQSIAFDNSNHIFKLPDLSDII